MKSLIRTKLQLVTVASLVAACSGAPSVNDAAGGAAGQAGTAGTTGTGPEDGEVKGSGAGGLGGGMGGGGGASAGGSAGAGEGGEGGDSGGGGAGGEPGAGGAAGAGGSGGSAAGGAPAVGPGVLTAGVWDDNRNFERFLGYRAELTAAQTPGLLGFSLAEHEAAHTASPSWLVPHEKLDIALVIDTTGSMTDEMEYLKAELIAISDTITKLHPNAEQRWSLIVYRDTTDDYVVRWFGLRSDVQDLQAKLALQTADGGGDFPEAPHAAFEKLNQLYWRSGPNVSRLAFWVADAPHHDDKAAAFTTALRGTRDLGIHVYPIASSGVDELTELSMRSAAQITGGRYMFLTDDSGVGGPHKEPSIPCYFVTKLDDAMVRMVDIEMSGKYREPAASEIIRTGGDPKNGACQLESGATVTVF
ncbi:MAG: VWA domain-containing protein [Myxococcales bacterium]|nr:VWA domain-containing protein [Myxococcales bacterium]